MIREINYFKMKVKFSYLIVIPTFLLICHQCQSFSISPFIRNKLLEQHRNRKLQIDAINRMRPKNFTMDFLKVEVEPEPKRVWECSVHRDCGEHEYCSCSQFCRNTYHDCNVRKRSIDPNWSEEDDEVEYKRSQRDCASRQSDYNGDYKCNRHSDCGCNRRCSCHGYCTYIC